MPDTLNAPTPDERRTAAVRITCIVHHRLAGLVRNILQEHEVRLALVEGGRNVRQLVRRRPFGIPGSTVRLEDTPVDVFTCTVAQSDARPIMREIVTATELTTPGRGSLFAQHVLHYGPLGVESASFPQSTHNASEPDLGQDAHDGSLTDLTQITAILSTPGSGEQLGGLALELGTCVPVVTGAVGTGMRDRLGLLRVTIPADKEVVSFLVPSYDAEAVVRFLAEEMRLDRPGRGFVYQTLVHSARVDTRLRIGRQEHAASIEQIVAAIDDLRRSTAWRKRFSAIDQDPNAIESSLLRARSEITVVCTEGNARTFTESALSAGASGATTSRVRSLYRAHDPAISSATEKSIIHVSSDKVESILASLSATFESTCDSCGWIQVVDSPVAFAHRPWSKNA
ncbi:MAG: hypothetical protein EA403_03750 [Spirochaetaceae bacterium]|nr:MAG: hypothetical protein EA403_03750 [Spirochaetaceae bacterium]